MLIVTIAALVMAASLGWFAYRLMQEEQRRSDARVAVLTAALDAPAAVPTSVPRAAERAWAATPSLPHTATNGSGPNHAARPVRPDFVMLEDDSRNVRAFRSEHDAAAPALPADLDRVDLLRATAEDARPLGSASVDTRDTGLFAAIPDARQGDARGWLALAAVVLVGALASGYALLGRDSVPAESVAAQPTTASAAAPRGTGVPLELVSLTHAQEPGALVVKGRVRNPVSGSDRPQIVARVALLDAAGVVVGRVETPVAAATLAAGRETTFQARLVADATVRRYRVTFSDRSGAQIVHLDRRAAVR